MMINRQRDKYIYIYKEKKVAKNYRFVIATIRKIDEKHKIIISIVIKYFLLVFCITCMPKHYYGSIMRI